MQQQVAPALKGKGGGRATEGSGVARCAGTGVSVLSIQQERRTGALVLALVSLAAYQPLVAVGAAVQDASLALFEAVAGVASDMALTPAAVLTRAGVTPVDHLLAEGTCQQRGV